MIIETISHTPSWVFILFFALLYLGFSQTKDRQISIQRLFILPSVMIALTLFSIVSAFGMQIFLFIIYFSSMFIFIFLASKIFTNKNTKYIKEENIFIIQGTWIPMILILCVFFIKYYIAYTLATSKDITIEPNFIYLVCMIYGIISGLFLARTLDTLKAKF